MVDFDINAKLWQEVEKAANEYPNAMRCSALGLAAYVFVVETLAIPVCSILFTINAIATGVFGCKGDPKLGRWGTTLVCSIGAAINFVAIPIAPVVGFAKAVRVFMDMIYDPAAAAQTRAHRSLGIII